MRGIVVSLLFGHIAIGNFENSGDMEASKPSRQGSAFKDGRASRARPGYDLRSHRRTYPFGCY